MEKVRCWMWCPIRANDSRREGRVRALGVKVKRIRVKRVSVVSSQHSGVTSLRAHIVAASICESKIERMPVSRQRRSKDEDSVITCAYRLRKGLERGE
jgi:hypothetical protein